MVMTGSPCVTAFEHPISMPLLLQRASTFYKFSYLSPKYQRLDDLTAAGFVIIAITNQSAIGRNLISPQELKNFHLKMKSPLTTKTVSDNAVFNAGLS